MCSGHYDVLTYLNKKSKLEVANFSKSDPSLQTEAMISW